MTATAADTPLISVIVPAYNEEKTIEQVVERLEQLDFKLEILICDDGSKDRTAEIARRLEGEHSSVRALIADKNRGKGAAVRMGIDASKGDIVLIQDADLEYDPVDIPELIRPLVEGRADAVYGSRLRGGEPQRAHLFWHYVGNRFLSLVTNVLFNTTISDMEVGYKAFRGDLIRSLKLVSNDFRFEPEVTAKVLKIKGVRLYEIPISYYGRTVEEGKKITWVDGIWAVGALIRFRIGD